MTKTVISYMLLLLGLFLINNVTVIGQQRVNILFEGCRLTFDSEDVATDSLFFEQIQKQDTVVVEFYPSNVAVEGIDFTIVPTASTQTIQIFQSYETSMTLMNEGPHLDLMDWKHHHSEWQPLELKNKHAQSQIIDQTNGANFPFVLPHEIVEAVRSLTEEAHWIELAKQCESPHHYPCGVGFSRLYFKLILTDKHHQKRTKYVVFELAMGC